MEAGTENGVKDKNWQFCKEITNVGKKKFNDETL